MDSSTAGTMVVNRPTPPFHSPHRTVDFSPLEFILGLIAVITIPALVYSFFFAIKCPPNLCRLVRRRSARLSGAAATAAAANITISKDVAVDVKYNKDEHFKDVGGECPVCLSVFGDGEEVRQLSACKHSFHVSCIDMWLYSHSNCPVCRASVTVKRLNSNGNGDGIRTTTFRNDDFQQGLPDAGGLV